MSIPPLLLIVGGLVVLASLVVLHVLPTGLVPWRDPVSQYGITRFRAGYAAAAIGAAVAGAGGALLLAGNSGGTTAASILLWVFAGARAVIPFFPMDAPEQPRTSRGRVHNLLAIAAFATVTAAGFLAAGTLQDSGYAGLSAVSTVAAIVMAVGSAGVILSLITRFRGMFGLAERLIYLGFIGWFLALGFGTLAGI